MRNRNGNSCTGFYWNDSGEGESSQLCRICCVVKGKPGGGWRVKSNLPSVAGTRQSCLHLPFPTVERRTGLFHDRLGHHFVSASFIYICACEAKAAAIRMGYQKWQVSVCIMSTSLCDTASPEAVYIICFNSPGTTDRFVLQWKCSGVMRSGIVGTAQ